jgi:UDP-N-acetyl-D-galactosamine dehydrogenase
MYKELVGKEKKLAVIGLGYVGLPIALEFAKRFRSLVLISIKTGSN